MRLVVGRALDAGEPKVGTLVIVEIRLRRAKSSMDWAELHANLVSERLESFGVKLELRWVRLNGDGDLAMIDRHCDGKLGKPWMLKT